MTNRKSVTLTFRGFAVEPSQVESLVGVKATLLRRKGEPVKQGVKTLMTRSAAQFQLEFEADEPLFRMVPALLAHLGGEEHLREVRRIVDPEFLEFDVLLNVRRSEDQEDGYFDNDTLTVISNLGATLGLSFPYYQHPG